jgi:hypothetical protein
MGVGKPRIRWFVIRLRTLLLLVLVAAVLSGWKADRVRRQRAAIDAVEDYGGHIYYDWNVDADGSHSDDLEEPRGPRWLRRLLGDDYFQDVVRVDFLHSSINPECSYDHLAVLDFLGAFPKLRYLDLNEAQSTDAGMERVGRLGSLECLVVEGTPQPFSDAGLAYLSGLSRLTQLHICKTSTTDKWVEFALAHPNLEGLTLRGPTVSDRHLARIRTLKRLRHLSVGPSDEITDAGLAYVGELTKLERLDLGNTRIADRGLPHFSRLVNMTNLDLYGTGVTDDSIPALKGLPKLRELDLRRSGVTGKGVKALQATNPSLEVYR